jgi:hypothetical protein
MPNAVRAGSARRLHRRILFGSLGGCVDHRQAQGRESVQDGLAVPLGGQQSGVTEYGRVLAGGLRRGVRATAELRGAATVPDRPKDRRARGAEQRGQLPA